MGRGQFYSQRFGWGLPFIGCIGREKKEEEKERARNLHTFLPGAIVRFEKRSRLVPKAETVFIL